MEPSFTAPVSSASNPLPIRKVTRLLADLQTTIVAGGLRCFEGDVDRFAIFSLIICATLQRADRRGGISVHSIALSLNRPFETVRRHVRGLVDSGHCARTVGGISVAPLAWQRPEIDALLCVTHDAFVRFVVDCADARALELPPPVPGAPAFTLLCGVHAAAEMLLGTLHSNRTVHNDAVDLVLFSTILHANATHYEDDETIYTPVEKARESFGASHAVRHSAVSRTLNIPETTVRRRLAEATGPDRAILRTPRGLVVSAVWMNRPQAAAVSEASYDMIRRILVRAAAAGFPFDAPTTAYLAGRPPSVRVL